MNPLLRCFFLIAILFSLILGTICSKAYTYNDVNNVNKVIAIRETPTIAIGGTGVLRMEINNPFESEMRNISLFVEPYVLICNTGMVVIDNITNGPVIQNNTHNFNIVRIDALPEKDNITINWTISTASKTAAGDFFSKGIYLVRIKISFDIEEVTVAYCSRGFFLDSDWNEIVKRSNSSFPIINLEYLKSLGYDGIIPETSFIVYEEFPVWPLLIVSAIAIASTILGFNYYIKENPEIVPKIYLIAKKIHKKIGKIRFHRK